MKEGHRHPVSKALERLLLCALVALGLLLAVPAYDEGRAERAIYAALAELDKPYVFGEAGPDLYDCSGLTLYAYGTVGVALEHSAYLQGYGAEERLPLEALRRGDLVCFDTVRDQDASDHVGIYLGGGQFVHASSRQGKVVVDSLESGYYRDAFSWGRALF